jgi:hypothetical protein
MGDAPQRAAGPRINFVFQTEREGVLSVRRLDAGTGR